ncbi:hypothetical protein [Pseudochrobactrum asaccharolyticum]|uniref:Uncharacterized protein n=1 Tax=Pseudochrobactrum asaccharolyticum TaxID=354351 RepID=A0A366DLR6_9HYPH|nr:hypothetical protein [Pseudochrobactrum asaccharolyticum]RBO91027.1 hypothetical protein DFR47_11024 [Pseudochrobactrum asaccharolyticum]
MRSVNIQYRQFVPESGASCNLHEAIVAALGEIVEGKLRRDVPKCRTAEIDDKGHAVLNRIDEFSNWTFGEVALFNPGQGVPVLIDKADSNVLDLKEMSLQNGQHLIKGVLYYINCDEHVVFIQPPNVSVGILRSYFEWLLCANGPKLGAPLNLEALVEASGEHAPKVEAIQVKARSELSSDSSPTMRMESVKDVKEAGRATSATTSMALDMARAAGMGPSDLQLLASLSEDGELVADLRLKLVKDGKTVKFDRIKASDLMTNQENDTISFYGENGKYHGSLTRVRYPGAKVKTLGDFLEPDDCRRVLMEAYNFFRSNGHIDGSPLEIE